MIVSPAISRSLRFASMIELSRPCSCHEIVPGSDPPHSSISKSAELACRQVLNEFGPDAEVFCLCDDPGMIETTLKGLLPQAFGPHNLNP